jgi:hypothetical protein
VAYTGIAALAAPVASTLVALIAAPTVGVTLITSTLVPTTLVALIAPTFVIPGVCHDVSPLRR